MKINPLALDGVFLLEHNVYDDNRGYFYESYNERIWSRLGLDFSPVQENVSYSRSSGTLRGLHFQLQPHAQAKAVRVIIGAVFDVVVDTRTESATYGQWCSVILSETNNRTLFVPKGFAHGFCTLEPDTRVVYLVDAFYAPEFEGGIHWNDPDLLIDWPVTAPLLSEKDRRLPLLRDMKAKPAGKSSR